MVQAQETTEGGICAAESVAQDFIHQSEVSPSAEAHGQNARGPEATPPHEEVLEDPAPGIGGVDGRYRAETIQARRFDVAGQGLPSRLEAEGQFQNDSAQGKLGTLQRRRRQAYPGSRQQEGTAPVASCRDRHRNVVHADPSAGKARDPQSEHDVAAPAYRGRRNTAGDLRGPGREG